MSQSAEDSFVHPLLAIGAADGRYRNKVEALAPLVSEFGLIRYRVQVECEWLIFLADSAEISQLSPLSDADRDYLRNIYGEFSIADAERVKAYEATTNHDVKAVEYFVKDALRERASLNDCLEWTHFAATSEDINNTAYGLMLSASRTLLLEHWQGLITELDRWADQYADTAMLSRTHGQTASPTTLGKEFKNVAARLQRQYAQLRQLPVQGKFNGAVGNFNAHVSAFPNADWPQLSARFIEQLGLTPNPWTTQIEPHDYVAEMFHAIMRFNQILLDFDRDIWSYISIEYFSQRKVEGETGSSTMPHKINPIDFENSEGNLGIANALLDHMAAKLAVSRWQRDLSDSTVLRNCGTAIAHCLIAYQATAKGLSRLNVNQPAIDADLHGSWEVLAEAVQTVMRKYAMQEPYERLKAATRGRRLTESVYQEILEELDLPTEAREELAGLTPHTYIGVAPSLARQPLPADPED